MNGARMECKYTKNSLGEGERIGGDRAEARQGKAEGLVSETLRSLMAMPLPPARRDAASR